MTNFQFEILRIGNYKTQQVKSGKLKPRRERRQEKRDRAKANKLNQKKNDRLSA